MTGAAGRVSTPASRAARAVRQGDTRRANLELALVGAVLVALGLGAARLAAGHLIDAPGESAGADIVRTWTGFSLALAQAVGLVTLAFIGSHVVRRLRGTVGDPWLLPIAAALCGLGLLTMASVNDPWRERLLFEPFAVGVAIGCVALTAASLVDFARLELHRFAFLFLCGALGLSVLLLVFGTGPGRSGVKVNLLGVQPVEAIRPLIAIFLASYFARRWEWLRELGEPLARRHRLLAKLRLPRVSDLIPVAIAMGLVLVFFFFQRDLGPALVISCTFLVTYSVARDRWGLALAGLLTLVGAFTAAYQVGNPATVVKRIDMWRSPWDNGVSGGDQVAHALWGLASGGLFGGGLSETSARYIPTGENDLVLASLGENLGFAGVFAVLALFGVIVVRALRIARRTDQPYLALLVVGLVTSLVAQTLLIVGGLLGLLPLSGVVTPFLSLGRSSMISNLAVIGLILAASRQSPPAEARPFVRPTSRLGIGVAVLLAIAAGRAFYVQVWDRGEVMTRQTKTQQRDGAVRPQDNPRLREVARLVHRGTILDRRGVPIAMESTLDVAKHAKDYAAMGVAACGPASAPPRGAAPAAARPGPERCYPLGGAGFHLLGDAVTKANWAAPNAAFVERDFDTRLRGYEDYAELLAIWDHRDEPFHPSVRAILDRPRDIQLTIDARLQAKAASVLTRKLGDLGLSKGAVVVLDVASGDVLAAVSAPWPRVAGNRAGLQDDSGDPDLPLLDRARYGQYPPGSTFKLVTAAAALRGQGGVADRHFSCRHLDDGRVGARLERWSRPVRDDLTDRVPHGDVTLDEGLRVSCNAYFAQLGLAVGAGTLKSTADVFEITTASSDTAADLGSRMPWAAYGQGEVLASPFRMARVAATMAARGEMPVGRWVMTPAPEPAPARRVLDPAGADRIARAMRQVVVAGTATALAGHDVDIAGKTGTAEVTNAPSHSWFVGFAPAAGPKRIAFAVIVENGGYGARAAVPIAGEVVTAARSLQIIP